MFSKRSLEGYLLIDHRAGPGVSAQDVAALGRHGAHLPVVPEGAVFESATVTCAHCQAVVVLNPNRTRPRRHCPQCDAYVCDSPVCATHVKSMDQLLDELQNTAARHR